MKGSSARIQHMLMRLLMFPSDKKLIAEQQQAQNKSAQQDDTIVQLKIKVSNLQQQNQRCNKQYDAEVAKLKDAIKQSQQLNAQSLHKLQQNSVLVEEQKKLSNLVSNQQAMLQQHANTIKDLKININQFQSAAKRQNQQIATLQTDLSNQQQRNIEFVMQNKSLTQQNTELHQEIRQLASSISSNQDVVRDLQGDVKAKENLLSIKNHQIEILQQELNDNLVHINQLQSNHSDKIQKMRANIRARVKWDKNIKIMISFRNWIRCPRLLPVSFIMDCKSINLDEGIFISPLNEEIEPKKINPQWSADYALLFYAWHHCVSPETKQIMRLEQLRDVYREWIDFKIYTQEMDYINCRRTRHQALDLTADQQQN